MKGTGEAGGVGDKDLKLCRKGRKGRGLCGGKEKNYEGCLKERYR